MEKKSRERVLGDSSELQARIEKARMQTERDCRRALKIVERLKDEMNKLEQNISQKEQIRTSQDLKALDIAIRRLNRLTDTQILQSKKAWKTYRRLEHDSEFYAFHSVQLDSLKVLCKKMEELAADLLCYSLARFNPSEKQS